MEMNDSELFEPLKRSLDKPSPLHFEEFLPWMCLEWQLPDTVMITKLLQEDYPKQGNRRASTRSGKSLKSKLSSFESIIKSKRVVVKREENTVPMTAYYDIEGYLVEVSIERCPFNISRTIIKIFGMCAPFHPLLYKLTIRRGGVTSAVLHEISNLLPNSFLTNICLDDANVPEGNYHVLLERASKVNSLSLNRCGIGDMVCRKLAANISFGKPNCTLQTLELSSNRISDAGAKAFGDILRRNRHLLHLNLSGNMITDTGALSILNHLMEFSLTEDDFLDFRRRKMKYAQQKIAVYEENFKERSSKQLDDQQPNSCIKIESPRSNSKGRLKFKKSDTINKLPDLDSLNEPLCLNLEDMDRKIVGEFSDPFDSDHVFKRNGQYYCMGNMVLSSLNLAYNNLEYTSIQKIHDVLIFQNQLMTKSSCTIGLQRVVIDGNYIPKHCEVYVEIDKLLESGLKSKVISDQFLQVLDNKKKVSWETGN